MAHCCEWGNWCRGRRHHVVAAGDGVRCKPKLSAAASDTLRPPPLTKFVALNPTLSKITISRISVTCNVCFPTTQATQCWKNYLSCYSKRSCTNKRGARLLARLLFAANPIPPIDSWSAASPGLLCYPFPGVELAKQGGVPSCVSTAIHIHCRIIPDDRNEFQLSLNRE